MDKGEMGVPQPCGGVRTQMLNIFYTQELTVTLTTNSQTLSHNFQDTLRISSRFPKFSGVSDTLSKAQKYRTVKNSLGAVHLTGVTFLATKASLNKASFTAGIGFLATRRGTLTDKLLDNSSHL